MLDCHLKSTTRTGEIARSVGVLASQHEDPSLIADVYVRSRGGGMHMQSQGWRGVDRTILQSAARSVQIGEW